MERFQQKANWGWSEDSDKERINRERTESLGRKEGENTMPFNMFPPNIITLAVVVFTVQ